MRQGAFYIIIHPVSKAAIPPLSAGPLIQERNSELNSDRVVVNSWFNKETKRKAEIQAQIDASIKASQDADKDMVVIKVTHSDKKKNRQSW